MKWLMKWFRRFRNLGDEISNTDANIKISIILDKLEKHNFYRNNQEPIKSIEPNVGIYTQALHIFLKYGIEDRYVVVKTIDLSSIENVRFVSWYSKDGYAFKNNEPLRVFLETTREFINIYEKVEPNDFLVVNKLRLAPYYNNLLEIIEYFYKKI